MNEFNPQIIPPDAWKKNRTRMARSVKRNMHLTETNPGSDAKRLRYDYILTSAEVDVFVEEIMRSTERLVTFYLAKEEGAPCLTTSPPTYAASFERCR